MSEQKSWEVVFPKEIINNKIYSRNQVTIKYSDLNARKLLSEKKEEMFTKDSDYSCVEIGGVIHKFNDWKYRLKKLSLDHGKLIFELGPARYSDYLIFRNNPELIGPVEKYEEYIPNIIGNVALLITTDKKAVAILRSQNVATYRGYLDLPGGHPELYINKMQNNQDELSNIMRDELFDSIIEEIREDLYWDDISLNEPMLLCVINNLQDLCKPDMVFLVTADVDSAAINEHFINLGTKPMEVDDLVIFDPFKEQSELGLYHKTPIMEGALEVFCNTIQSAQYITES